MPALAKESYMAHNAAASGATAAVCAHAAVQR